MTAAALTLGGGLSRACETCGASPGAWCTSGRRRAAQLHASRRQGAPPEQTATVGDLVLVSTTPQARLAAAPPLAVIVGIGLNVSVRLWRGHAGFARPRPVTRAGVLALAPESDPRVSPARAWLASEQEAAPTATPTTTATADVPALSAAAQGPPTATPTATATISGGEQAWSTDALVTKARRGW